MKTFCFLCFVSTFLHHSNLSHMNEGVENELFEYISTCVFKYVVMLSLV